MKIFQQQKNTNRDLSSTQSSAETLAVARKQQMTPRNSGVSQRVGLTRIHPALSFQYI